MSETDAEYLAKTWVMFGPGDEWTPPRFTHVCNNGLRHHQYLDPAYFDWDRGTDTVSQEVRCERCGKGGIWDHGHWLDQAVLKNASDLQPDVGGSYPGTTVETICGDCGEPRKSMVHADEHDFVDIDQMKEKHETNLARRPLADSARVAGCFRPGIGTRTTR